MPDNLTTIKLPKRTCGVAPSYSVNGWGKRMTDISTTRALERPGVYARGSGTVDLILKAALNVLTEEGSAGFTLRRVASECGLKGGNVSYHFPRKAMLFHLLFDEWLRSGEDSIERKVRLSSMSAEDALAMIIRRTLDDIGTKRTTHLLTELWVMANHDEFIADRVEACYRRVDSLIGEFVAKLNPALSSEDVEAVSLFISASMAGMTMASGFGRPWVSKMPQIKAIAVSYLVDLAKTVTTM
jgi:AcrR family transcriptional regulator